VNHFRIFNIPNLHIPFMIRRSQELTIMSKRPGVNFHIFPSSTEIFFLFQRNELVSLIPDNFKLNQLPLLRPNKQELGIRGKLHFNNPTFDHGSNILYNRE
jgi:hypothetical protein